MGSLFSDMMHNNKPFMITFIFMVAFSLAEVILLVALLTLFNNTANVSDKDVNSIDSQSLKNILTIVAILLGVLTIISSFILFVIMMHEQQGSGTSAVIAATRRIAESKN